MTYAAVDRRSACGHTNARADLHAVPNATEFSCGFSFPYSANLLHRAAGYNSS